MTEDVGTPKFDDRTKTAVFGSFQEMSQAVGEKKETSSAKDVKCEPEIVLKTFAGKKSKLIFHYNQRELVLFSNGSVAYKKKNKSESTRQTITRSDMVKITRNK